MDNQQIIPQLEQKKKSPVKKLVLIGAGIAVLGFASYYGWQYFQNKKNDKEENSSSDNAPENFVPKLSSSPPPLPKANDDFPLKKGSKGDKVKALQQALINKYGKSILPRYGADGDFGNEMAAALQKSNLPSEIDETTFNVLVKSSSLDVGTLAKGLYDAAVAKDFAKVIAGLSQMKTVDDYTSVGNIFKTYELRGVRQTLVNGILGTFSDTSQKQQIQLQFSRMGLKYDGTKWSLSGILLNQIITKTKTWVYKYPNEKILVEPNVVLGIEIASRKGFTLFESMDNHQLIVKTKDIKYYEKH